jgi:hypothetical protein
VSIQFGIIHATAAAPVFRTEQASGIGREPLLTTVSMGASLAASPVPIVPAYGRAITGTVGTPGAGGAADGGNSHDGTAGGAGVIAATAYTDSATGIVTGGTGDGAANGIGGAGGGSLDGATTGDGRISIGG